MPHVLTESDIQNGVWRKYTGRALLIVPCSYVFGWESDMVVVTRALISHEFEIKLTKPDFRADTEKVKWGHFTRWQNGEREYEKHFSGAFSPWVQKLRVWQPPNYFWYIVPAGLVVAEEVPEFAGLVYTSDYGSLMVQKKPKKLHSDHLTQRHVLQLCGSLNGRYWSDRLDSYDKKKARV